MAVGRGYEMAAGGTGGMRASDADRERAIEVLKVGYTDGRLPKDDYDELLGRAYAAPTRADLEFVTAQLPGGGPALYASAMPRTNQMAVASLACGVGQLIVGPLSTIPAIVLGHIAHRQIRQTGDEGAGLATAGIVLGWIGAAFTVLGLIIVVILIAAVAHAVHHTPVPGG